MKKRVITQEIEIDYENGFTCNYTMIDNEVNEYHFSYGFDSVCYIDDISNYKQNPNKDLCFSEEGLLSFDEFDKLFFVSRNNYLRDPKTKKFIPTLIHYKSTYKNKLKCKAFINSLDQKYIKNISIEDTVFDPFLTFDILLPEELFVKLMNTSSRENFGKEAANLIKIK